MFKNADNSQPLAQTSNEIFRHW